MKLLRPCSKPGCNNLVNSGRCNVCTSKRKSNPSGKKDDNVKRWLNSARYRNARKRFLKGKFCVHCLKRDILEPATILDHIIPHKGDSSLFWNSINRQPLCESCHNRKTATEDGGFGN